MLVAIGFRFSGGNDLNSGRAPEDVAADMQAFKEAGFAMFVSLMLPGMETLRCRCLRHQLHCSERCAERRFMFFGKSCARSVSPVLRLFEVDIDGLRIGKKKGALLYLPFCSQLLRSLGTFCTHHKFVAKRNLIEPQAKLRANNLRCTSPFNPLALNRDKQTSDSVVATGIPVAGLINGAIQ